MKTRPWYSFLNILRFSIWIGFSLILILPLLGFYPWKFRIGFCVFFALFAVLDLVSPFFSTFLLAASGPLFGNHPGGRFLELQDCLWIFWCLRGILENKRSGNSFFSEEFRKSRTGFLLLSFFFAAFLSLLANPDLFADLRFYRKGWFWFLHSTELEPWYPIKVLGMGILFLFGFLSRRDWLDKSENQTSLIKVFSFGVSAGLLFSVAIGWMEYFSPFVKSSLDGYHRWLDGYKLVTSPHSILPFFDRFLPESAIQSLYWNRSWFAVSILSALPFLFAVVLEKQNSKNRIWVLGIFFILAITLLGIGARGAFVAFGVLIFVSWFHQIVCRLSKEDRLRKKIFLTFSILLVGIGVLFPFLTIWMEGGTQGQDRLSHFVAAKNLGLSKLLLGGGFESFGWYNECCIQTGSRASFFHTSHNQFLQIFAGMGLLGVAVFSFLWIEILCRLSVQRTSDEDVWSSSLIFGSISAIFVYSFFQEWFYLRAVFFQWIGAFFLFSFKGDIENSKNKIFQKKNVFLEKTQLFSVLRIFIRENRSFGIRGMVSLLSISLSLVFCSRYLYPTFLFRSGVFFPPGQDSDVIWILEGKSFMELIGDQKKRYTIHFTPIADSSHYAVTLAGQKKEVGRMEEKNKTETFVFDIYEKKNILKIECTSALKGEVKDSFIFWQPHPMDPEPRKFCARIRIQN
ncbi:O-antigen ligase family protein [Leptospira sp. WS92.C1]